MSNEKINSEKMKEALIKGLKAGGKIEENQDVVLTDSDLEDVAGGCVAMCGTMTTAEE